MRILNLDTVSRFAKNKAKYQTTADGAIYYPQS